jgi:hypothetical protein
MCEQKRRNTFFRLTPSQLVYCCFRLPPKLGSNNALGQSASNNDRPGLIFDAMVSSTTTFRVARTIIIKLGVCCLCIYSVQLTKLKL